MEDLTLNLYPPSWLLADAYMDLISAWNWSSFAIVYEDPKSIIKLQDLFRESSGSWTSRWQIKLFQLNRRLARNDSSSSDAKNRKLPMSFRDIFWRVKLSGERNILLDVPTERLHEALKHAQQVGCMTDQYSYLITSLDLHTIELEDFKYGHTRITALTILQVDKTNHSSSSEWLDEKYLERLGVHVVHQDSHDQLELEQLQNGAKDDKLRVANSFKLSPSVVLDRFGAFMEPPLEAYKAESSGGGHRTGSMSLLPQVSRDNEQALFEFLLRQQRRNLSQLRLSTASAILHDSLILYTLGLSELDPAQDLLAGGGRIGGLTDKAEFQVEACALRAQPWLMGSSLANYMRRVSFTGLTGKVSFDQRGLRTDFRLDVIGMAPNVGLVKIGEWLSENRHSKWTQKEQREDEFSPLKTSYAQLSASYLRELGEYRSKLANGLKVDVPYTKRLSTTSRALQVNEIIFARLYAEQSEEVDTLIVTTKLSQPYFMLKETPNKLEGNDQYEGFAVDLIHELSKLVNFRYRWREVADKKYGSKEVLPNGTVQWNGMIGEIVRGLADLAIVDLTITAQREEAVDFTLPFMNTGISILFKKPTTKVTTLFSFLSPFSSDVWAYVLFAYCSISAILFLVGHLSPYEWADPHPCRHSSADQLTVLKNQFSLLNSFWFTIGSLMQQGSDLTPRSMSTRTIAGIWYFFTLIMISSYTANLAAFLTVEKVVYPIENVRDLSNQQEIKYGCVESGSTCTFFHDSQIDTYKRINETMRKFRSYVRSNDDGQRRVEEGKFAFFMESASIEYIIERNCNLTQIGGLLDSKGYGLATSKKSKLKRPYRTLLSEGILHLQETGMLHVLKNRWWKERRGGGTCTDDSKGGGVTELSLANVGGVFVVLLGGLGISFLVAIAEFMWRARRGGKSRDKMCEEMMSDLKFALACKRSTKPAAKSRSQRRGRSRHLLLLSQEQQKRQEQLLYSDQLRQKQQHQQQQQQSFQSCLSSPIQSSGQLNSQADLLARQLLSTNHNKHQSNPALLRQMLIQQQQQYQHQLYLANDRPADQQLIFNGYLDAAAASHQGRRGDSLQQSGSSYTSAAAKRRLLFAQQTIDSTPDDSFCGR